VVSPFLVSDRARTGGCRVGRPDSSHLAAWLAVLWPVWAL